MAEQYQSFNSKEPNVDVNLYVNALTQGIAAGNAQKSTTGAIFSGISEGVKSGMQAYTGMQQIQANSQNAEIRQQQIDLGNEPGVQDARADVIRGQGAQARQQATIADLQNGVLQANKQIATETAEADLKSQFETSTQKLGDIQNAKSITEAMSSGQPGNLEAVLKDPSMTATLLRNTELGQKFLGSAAGKIDPALEKTARNQFDAVAMQKQRMQQLEDETKLKTTRALKMEDSAAEATAGLQSIPQYAEASKGDRFDYRRTRIIPSNEVSVINGKLETNPDGTVKRKSAEDLLGATKDDSFIMTQGNKVIVPYMSHEEGTTAQKHLNTYKAYGAAKGYPTYGDDEPPVKSAPEPTDPTAPLGLASRNPVPTASTGPEAFNNNIVANAKARNEEHFKESQSIGQGSSYQGFIQKGSTLARANMPTPDYIKTSQNVPTPPGQPTFTTPVPESTINYTPKTLVGPVEAEKHLSSVMGGADVTLNIPPTVTPVSGATINRINAIPSLANKSAYMKGLFATESAGKIDALGPVTKSGERAGGVAQFMPGTAAEMGLSSDDRFNPDKAAPAAVEYISKQYERFEKVFNQAYSEQGLSIKPDPRMISAAFNGGPEWIVRGIRAGNTTWDQMDTYIRSVKSEKAAAENLAYVDKVTAASIPFIKGGNGSDDSYVKTLINFGILDVA